MSVRFLIDTPHSTSCPFYFLIIFLLPCLYCGQRSFLFEFQFRSSLAHSFRGSPHQIRSDRLTLFPASSSLTQNLPLHYIHEPICGLSLFLLPIFNILCPAHLLSSSSAHVHTISALLICFSETECILFYDYNYLLKFQREVWSFETKLIGLYFCFFCFN